MSISPSRISPSLRTCRASASSSPTTRLLPSTRPNARAASLAAAPGRSCQSRRPTRRGPRTAASPAGSRAGRCGEGAACGAQGARVAAALSPSRCGAAGCVAPLGHRRSADQREHPARLRNNPHIHTLMVCASGSRAPGRGPGSNIRESSCADSRGSRSAACGPGPPGATRNFWRRPSSGRKVAAERADSRGSW